MIQTFEGWVHQGDEAIRFWKRASDGVDCMSRIGVIRTDEEKPSLISFYSRDPELISIYPLKVGSKVRVTVDERDHKDSKGFWQMTRTLVKVEYIEPYV